MKRRREQAAFTLIYQVHPIFILVVITLDISLALQDQKPYLFPSYVRLLRILHKHGISRGREQARSSIGCSRMNATSGTELMTS